MIRYEISNNIFFKIFDEPVGVCVSGGVDSALLLYFTLKYSTYPVHIFSFASQTKFLKNPMKSIQVVSKCAELTSNYNLEHHIVYDVEQTKENLFLLPFRYLEQHKISKICSGITKNPPIDITTSFNLPEEDTENAERDPNIIRNDLQDNFYMPWTNLDKKDLANIYKEHSLTDNLFSITRSCEWVNEQKHGVDPGLEHCGKCWWCKERMWGFGKLC